MCGGGSIRTMHAACTFIFFLADKLSKRNVIFSCLEQGFQNSQIWVFFEISLWNGIKFEKICSTQRIFFLYKTHQARFCLVWNFFSIFSEKIDENKSSFHVCMDKTK